MTINFGNIKKYNTKRGFGFVSQTIHNINRPTRQAFFHITTVNSRYPDLAQQIQLENTFYQDNRLLEFNGFSDIAFNPKKSLNCQARAAALFVALSERGEIKKVLKDRDYYMDLIQNKNSSNSSSVKNIPRANTDLEKSLQLELPL